MSSTEPPTRPSTATITNGTRNQVGSSVGQRADRVGRRSRSAAPARSRPAAARRSTQDRGRPRRRTSSSRPRRAPDAARQVAGVVRGRVDPAEPEAGDHEDQRADERLGRAGGQAGDRRPVDVAGGQDHVDDGQDAGDQVIHRCSRMITSKPATPAATVSAATTISATSLVAVPPPQPSGLNTVAVRQRGEHDQNRLPADGEQPGDRRRQLVAAHAERGPGHHHGRRRAALAGDRDHPAERERRRRCRPRRRSRACQNEIPKPSTNAP